MHPIFGGMMIMIWLMLGFLYLVPTKVMWYDEAMKVCVQKHGIGNCKIIAVPKEKTDGIQNTIK